MARSPQRHRKSPWPWRRLWSTRTICRGAKILWVKKSCRKMVGRLKIATYNISTLPRDEHLQELKEELRETRLVCNWHLRSEKTRGMFTLQSGHLLYHSKANNGQAGVGFLINRKWKDHIVRVTSISPWVAELVLCLTKSYKLKNVQVYAPTAS